MASCGHTIDVEKCEWRKFWLIDPPNVASAVGRVREKRQSGRR